MQSNLLRRRAFFMLLGGAAAWPRAAGAQQTAMPVIGFLGANSPGPYAQYAAALRQGLKETGFIEDRNLKIEYRWAEGQYDRLPEMAADLLLRKVAVIVPIGGAPAVIAAKKVTSTVPIVFTLGADPVQLGLVASLNRTGGNVTGVAMLATTLEAKRLEVLRELVPTAAVIAILVNPTNPQSAALVRDLEKAADAIGQTVRVLHAASEPDFEKAFSAISQLQVPALMVGADGFFFNAREHLVELAARHGLPSIYEWREFTEIGGLASYGTSLSDAYRQAGIYTGRILNGATPADLPVIQPTKFELVINLKTAKALGLNVPPSLLVRADEVIE
jgi:putative ABC transport system substrate-binding protein